MRLTQLDVLSLLKINEGRYDAVPTGSLDKMVKRGLVIRVIQGVSITDAGRVAFQKWAGVPLP